MLDRVLREVDELEVQPEEGKQTLKSAGFSLLVRWMAVSMPSVRGVLREDHLG